MSYWLFSNTTHILIALGVELEEEHSTLKGM